MELILLIIYSIIVWFIFFKKKWLPWNITSQVIVVTIPIIALTIIILFMNIVAPSSHDVRAMNYVIPIVPRVTGQVTEVPIEPNRPIKKGDVLFKIDPVPFEQAVKAAEATLAELKVGLITAEAYQRGLEDQLKNADGEKGGARRRGSTWRKSASSNSPRSPRPVPEARRPRAGAMRSRQSRKRIPRGRRHRIEDQAEDRRAHRRPARSTKSRRPRRRSPRPKRTS